MGVVQALIYQRERVTALRKQCGTLFLAVRAQRQRSQAGCEATPKQPCPLITICGRVKGRPAIEQDGRVRRRAKVRQHNEADSEPRTSWRVGAASQSARLLVLLVTKVLEPANASSHQYFSVANATKKDNYDT